MRKYFTTSLLLLSEHYYYILDVLLQLFILSQKAIVDWKDEYFVSQGGILIPLCYRITKHCTR